MCSVPASGSAGARGSDPYFQGRGLVDLLHALFNAGCVTVTPSPELRVCRRIREAFENGRDYYALDHRPARVPAAPAPPPSHEYLEWHGDTVFRV